MSRFTLRPLTLLLASVLSSLTLFAAPGIVSAQTGRASVDPQLAQLHSDLLLQLKLSYRFDKPEHERRLAALEATLNSAASVDQAALRDWLTTAIRASMPGASTPMPAPLTAPLPAAAEIAEVVAAPSSDSPDSPPQDSPAEKPPIVDFAVAARLWAESPASSPISLVSESTPAAPASAATVIAQAPATVEPAAEQAPVTAAKSRPARPTSSQPTPNIETADHIAGLFDADFADTTEALAAPAFDTLEDPGLSSVELDTATESEEPAFLFGASEPENYLLLDNGSEIQPSERVTTLKPTLSSASASPSDTNLGVDTDRLSEQVARYNEAIQQLTEEVTTAESPTAFQIRRWMNRIEALGRDRQVASLYVAGVEAGGRQHDLEFASADPLITGVGRRIAERQSTLAGLPGGFVQSEFEVLAELDALLPELRAAHE